MKIGFVLGAALAISVAGAVIVPMDAEAYKPSNMNAGSNLLVALQTCRGPLAKGNPGLVSQTQYDGYIEGRDKALAAEPGLKDWDELDPSRVKVLGATPKEMLPKCDDFFAKFASGVNADAQPDVNPICIVSFDHYVGMTRSYLKDWKAGDTKPLAFYARQNLERARYTLTRKGATPGTRVCDSNDQFKTKATPLKQTIASLEADVLKLEAERDVKFAGIDRGSIPVFTQVSTGKRIERGDRY